MSQESFQEQLRALLATYSEKAASAYSQAAPEVLPLLSPITANRWVELGCTIAQSSATAAVKYFRESPDIIKAFPDRSNVQPALEIGLRLAARDYGIVLEYFRQCPQVLPKIGTERLQDWAQIAAEMAGQSDSVGYGTAIEYFKESAKILDHLSVDHLSSWAQLGRVLALEDQKNKDFLALEYFRISPELLSQVLFKELRPVLLEIALPLAKTSSKLAMDFLKQCPQILMLLNGLKIQRTVLEIGKTLAQVAPTVVPVLISHCAEVLMLTEGSLTQFQQWAQQGIEIARTNPERAGAYFSLKLKVSHDALRQLSSGIFLKDISRMLRYYAEGLSGRPVEIKAGPTGLPTTPDGVITLPEKIAFFTQPEDNFRFYKVMTFHEAGHLEFGSDDPVSCHVINDIEDDTEVGLKQTLRALLPDVDQGSRMPVQRLLEHFPDSALAKDLWMIVEEGRTDYLLRHEYRGIQKDMDFVIVQQIKGRPAISQLLPRQAVLEALLQLSVADTAEVPLGIAEVVAKAYAVLKTVQHPTARVDDSLKAVCSLYVLIKKYLQGFKEEPAMDQEKSIADPPKADVPDEMVGMGHGSLNNLSYRNPLELQDIGKLATPQSPFKQPSPSLLKETTAPQHPGETLPERDHLPVVTFPIHPAEPSGEGIYYYDEWDVASGDYRSHWCRLEEKTLETAPSEVVDRIKGEYGSVIRLLRRYFEYLRPQAFKKIKKQEYGEEIDLESAIESLTERMAGLPPSDRVYSLRQKKTRDVSAAFLVDMSGSTSQQIGSGSGWNERKRVIDVEKEGLILLGEALKAIGDEFAMFGFSGHSRNQVNFYKIKDFDEGYGDAVHQRIGAIQPQGQNRDGTAIRHMTAKLLERPAKIKLLILLSDGKPLDEEYNGIHALEDTRMALQEARTHGVHPFCITVDRDAREYIQEMYDQVSYTIISNITTLPQRLPRIYKQLTT